MGLRFLFTKEELELGLEVHAWVCVVREDQLLAHDQAKKGQGTKANLFVHERVGQEVLDEGTVDLRKLERLASGLQHRVRVSVEGNQRELFHIQNRFHTTEQGLGAAQPQVTDANLSRGAG